MYETTDHRAAMIWFWLNDNTPSTDAMKYICYAIQKLESEGELEIFITEEIDKMTDRIKI